MESSRLRHPCNGHNQNYEYYKVQTYKVGNKQNKQPMTTAGIYMYLGKRSSYCPFRVLLPS